MAPSSSGGGAGSMVPTFVMFGAVILVFYFLMIRPQQKRQKAHQDMIANLKIGDKVVTTAGMHGKIEKIDDKTVVLQMDSIKITFEKSAIVSKIEN